MNLAILEFKTVYVFILRGIVSVRMQHILLCIFSSPYVVCKTTARLIYNMIFLPQIKLQPDETLT